MQYSSDFVRPLQEAENSFLQVLLTSFDLVRSGLNTALSLRFDNRTPAIWTRHGKSFLKENIPDFDRKKALHQERLDAVLLHRTADSLRFDDPDFPFRYGSGGTLPILRKGDREYFCLFYRDIYPAGWNIANGGSDSRAEMLYPLTTIERELREELLIFNPAARHRYVFSWDYDTPEDRSEYAMARNIWTSTRPDLDIANFAQLTLPLKWLEGPDSIAVQMGNESNTEGGCFLNINATDFGIEIDKIAKISVADDVVLLDGEIMDNKILNRPVGLFDLDEMNNLLKGGATRFIPHHFYYNGRRHEGERFEEMIANEFTSSLTDVRSDREIAYFTELKDKFDLCPVTRAILFRYGEVQPEAAQEPPHPVAAGPKPPRSGGKEYEMFISCGSGDEPVARKVYEFVTNVKKKTAYFYEEDFANRWGRQIDDALSSAQCLIVVGTDALRLERDWPEYEWRSFHNAMQDGRKPHAKLIPFVVGVKPQMLPYALNYYKMVVCEDVASGLARLDALMA